MCIVCKNEGFNLEFLNGTKSDLTDSYKLDLYDKKIILCYVHSVDLFKLGDSKFIRKYPYIGGKTRVLNSTTKTSFFR